MKRKNFLYRMAVMTTVGVMATTVLQPLTVQAANFPNEYVNHKKALKHATLRVAYAADSPFRGVFMPFLNDDVTTLAMASPGEVKLSKNDENGKLVKGGFADVKFDRKNKTALVTVNKKTRWSDGEPVTSRDVAFTYEIVANKDSGSPYYSSALENVVGVKEYHEGQADKISGLEEKDERHLLIHFKEMSPTLEYVGSSSLYNDAQPYHYLKDVPFSELAQSDKLRTHPLFFGPYQVKKVVQGESIEWVPNKYYGGPKPKLDKVVMEIVPTSLAAEAMRANKYDMLLNTATAGYSKLKKDKNLVTLGSLSTDFTYLGFKVGYANDEGVSVMEPSLPTSDRTLRQAVAYAMNVKEVVDNVSNGVTKQANSVISPAYGNYHDKKLKPYLYNLKKANKLLDKAGYKRGKDGYRTMPNGKKLTLTLLAAADDKTGEALRANYIQLWKKVGLKVKLYGGRSLDYNNFLKVLMSKNKNDFDLWINSWSLPEEPTSLPNFAYTPDSEFNYGHFVSKENSELIASFNSPKAFNEKYRIEQMHKWQAYMQKEAYIVPLTYNYDLQTVTKKVKGMNAKTGDKQLSFWDSVALTK